MQRTLESLLARQHFASGRMAFVVGPRQVGKTTLARRLLEARGTPDLYRTWDDLAWRRSVSRDPYGFVDGYRPNPRTGPAKPLAVLDEVHRFPGWKRYLKGLWDTRKNRVDVVVTGSGRLDVYQKGGDSLLGRYHQYRLHPLTVHEVVDPESPAVDYDPDETLERLTQAAGAPPPPVRDAFLSLVRWGGFPEPFVKRDARQLRRWHRERRDLIVREDLRDLSRIQLLSHVEELIELLVPRAGGILSLNALREDLQVALDSVRLWISYLERLYFVYRVRPYAARLPRALRREPKVYLWDWSEIADPAARLENMVANHLLKWCHFTQDWGHPPLDLHFVRDKEKREVDFLITREKKPWLLVEVKLSRTAPEAALQYVAGKLGVKHKFQVVAELERPGQAADVHVLDAPTFLACLPV
jgi:predicted AAA+ superfamily ATPase